MGLSSKLFSRRLSWTKKGLLFEPVTSLWWMNSHAAAPTANYIGEGIFRVYFSGRDNKNRSQIGWFDVKPNEGILEFIEYSKEPILENGSLDVSMIMGLHLLVF